MKRKFADIIKVVDIKILKLSWIFIKNEHFRNGCYVDVNKLRQGSTLKVNTEMWR